MRELRGATERLLRFRQILKLDETLPEPRPRKPILRILLNRLLEDGDSLVASAFLIQSQGELHVSPCQILGYGGIVRRVLVSHGEYGQIVLPCAFLLHG